MAIIGASPEGITLSTNQSTMVVFVTLLARKLILVIWKSPNTNTNWQYRYNDIKYGHYMSKSEENNFLSNICTSGRSGRNATGN